MQISEKIFKAVEYLKKKDLWAKITLTVVFLSYLSFCHTCYDPYPREGETYPIYEYGDKNLKQCELDGKKLFLEQEYQNKSFWYNFLLILGLIMFGALSIKTKITLRKIF